MKWERLDEYREVKVFATNLEAKRGIRRSKNRSKDFVSISGCCENWREKMTETGYG